MGLGEVVGVGRVVCVRAVGDDVARPRRDDHRAGEIDLLPAAGGLIGEDCSGKHPARGTPQIGHVRARILRTLVEATPNSTGLGSFTVTMAGVSLALKKLEPGTAGFAVGVKDNSLEGGLSRPRAL
jgi:hypothetical protein